MIVVVMVCEWGCVDGHGKMLYPAPRAGSGARTATGTKIAIFPVPADLANSCGGTQNSDPGPLAVQATFQSSSSINVVWQTTITHVSAPGVRIAIRYTPSDNFSDSENILANGLDVGSSAGTGCHNATVQLDGRTSDAAVLQWIWASQADGGFYISCADVKVQATPVPGSATNNYDLYNGQCLGLQPTPTPTSKPSQDGSGGGKKDKKGGMSPGGQAALAIFLIALFATVAVAGYLYYKNGSLFGYKVTKGGIVKANAKQENNYVAFNDTA